MINLPALVSWFECQPSSVICLMKGHHAIMLSICSLAAHNISLYASLCQAKHKRKLPEKRSKHSQQQKLLSYTLHLLVYIAFASVLDRRGMKCSRHKQQLRVRGAMFPLRACRSVRTTLPACRCCPWPSRSACMLAYMLTLAAFSCAEICHALTAYHTTFCLSITGGDFEGLQLSAAILTMWTAI